MLVAYGISTTAPQEPSLTAAAVLGVGESGPALANPPDNEPLPPDPVERDAQYEYVAPISQKRPTLATAEWGALCVRRSEIMGP